MFADTLQVSGRLTIELKYASAWMSVCNPPVARFVSVGSICRSRAKLGNTCFDCTPAHHDFDPSLHRVMPMAQEFSVFSLLLNTTPAAAVSQKAAFDIFETPVGYEPRRDCKGKGN